jgi:hypothetical protein
MFILEVFVIVQNLHKYINGSEQKRYIEQFCSQFGDTDLEIPIWHYQFGGTDWEKYR